MITRGHSKAQGGLRGHSIGETYPITVSGKGDKWIIWNALSGKVYAEGGDCKAVHELAREFSRRLG